jgi:hypothetical protein
MKKENFQPERRTKNEYQPTTETCKDSRAGHYTRGLHTTAGPVKLKVPKLRKTYVYLDGNGEKKRTPGRPRKIEK